MSVINIREAKIALVNNTTEGWNSETKIPIKGCPCIEWTGSNPKMKIGDGEHLYKDLPYLTDDLTSDLIITALGYTPIDSETIGAENGVASLDANGKVPDSQLPDYNNIIEVDNITTAPTIGITGKIYIATDTCICYRWDGTQYTEISKSPTIDDVLSDDSTNPVQNKIVKAALDNKLDVNDTIILNCIL